MPLIISTVFPALAIPAVIAQPRAQGAVVGIFADDDEKDFRK
jgi:hypothetical protein